MKSTLQQKIEAGDFAITAEVGPPKGTDFSRLQGIAKKLVGRVHGVNATDFQSAAVKASSLAVCIEMQKWGLEPVLQMTGRDRNRIAIQGELLSAGHFGVQNLLCLTGDHPVTGDNPEAMPVYEFDAVSILQTASVLNGGEDLGGNALTGSPDFFLGAVVSPVYEPLELQLIRMRNKMKAGARFFQSQAVFDVEALRHFREETAAYPGALLVGIIPLKSAGMARFMNAHVPGVMVPDAMIDRMDKAADPVAEGIIMAGEFIAQIKAEGLCDGINVMAIGAEENVPAVLDVAGL